MQSQCCCIPRGTSTPYVEGQKVVKSLTVERTKYHTELLTLSLMTDCLTAPFLYTRSLFSARLVLLCNCSQSHIPRSLTTTLWSQVLLLWREDFMTLLPRSIQGSSTLCLQANQLPKWLFRRPRGSRLRSRANVAQNRGHVSHIAWNGFKRSHERIKPNWSSSNVTAFWNKANHLLSLNQASKVQILNNLTAQCSAYDQKLLEMPRIRRM